MKCWYCHETMEQRTINRKHLGHMMAIPAWECPACGEIVFEAAVLAEIEEQYGRQRRKRDEET